MLGQIQYCKHSIPISSAYSCAHCDEENTEIKRAVPRYPNPLEDFTKQKTAEQQQIAAILAERGSRYGDFTTHAKITQDIKCVMSQCPRWQNLNCSQREALEMIAHKIGRILNGDPNYADSWVDIAGYAKLVADRLQQNEQQEKK